MIGVLYLICANQRSPIFPLLVLVFQFTFILKEDYYKEYPLFFEQICIMV